jgi:hypothetical protein
MAVEALDKLEPRRAELARQLPQAENEEAAAFARAQPAAAAELATRQERGNLAREILAERRQQDREQEQARERTPVSWRTKPISCQRLSPCC